MNMTRVVCLSVVPFDLCADQVNLIDFKSHLFDLYADQVNLIDFKSHLFDLYTDQVNLIDFKSHFFSQMKIAT